MKKSTTNNVKTKLDTKKLEQDINTKITNYNVTNSYF
jgi:hypothetical protein